MRLYFKRHFLILQFGTGLPLAIQAWLSAPELGLLGPLVAFLAASPLAALGAFFVARRDMRGPVQSQPMTVGRALKIAFVTFFMLIGIITFLKIAYEMYLE